MKRAVKPDDYDDRVLELCDVTDHKRTKKHSSTVQLTTVVDVTNKIIWGKNCPHIKSTLQEQIKAADSVGLKINSRKIKIMKINVKKRTRSKLQIRNWNLDISKEYAAYNKLKNIWKSKLLQHLLNLRLYKSNVRSVLLCLRCVLKNRWPIIISNNDLEARKSMNIVAEVKR
ncbi:hypothetical protein KUTeg_000635 [Tegillarca granosa]|uniref:Endonuclease-reverse transcriptase n=1 Tax=Tegillarca granosa TaxID=220873 RepID=A0ABQ9FY50_TEGGR|nr:hypothetical protein KUTeg_000635 [Tegillarca granosa]